MKAVPIEVENSGTLDLSYRIRPYIKNDTKINNVSIMEVLRVKATDSNSNVLFNGLFKDLNNGGTNKNLDSVNGFLKAKSSDIMNFEFYLPGDNVGNNYQNLSGELGFNVDAVQYLYIFMKGYPTGNKVSLTINELNSTADKTKLIAVTGSNYSCSLEYEDGSVVPKDVAIIKAAEDSKFPNSGQVCFEYRIAKSVLDPNNNAVTVTAITSYSKSSTVKVTENKKYFFKK